MRTAVVCVDLADPEAVVRSLVELRQTGHTVRARSAGGLEILVEAVSEDDARRLAVQACGAVAGAALVVSSVTFVSRGTDDDVLGVVAGFGFAARVERVTEDGQDVVVVRLATADRDRVPESRMSTALEAALNCSVRLEFD